MLTKDLSITFCGVKFPNPFCLSSSPVGNCYEMCAKAYDTGWGGVVFKTIGFFIANVPNIASSTLLPLVEENTGRRVFLVSPDVTVASPPYRYRQGPALHLQDQQLRGALFD